MLNTIRFLRTLTILAAVGCAPGLDAGASRTVVLQFTEPPTSADSISASRIGGSPATMYPLVDAIAVHTTLPVSAFAAMQPKPFASDLATAGRNCGALTVELYVNGTPTSADSAFVVNAGFEEAFLILHVGPPLIAAGLAADNLPAINRLQRDSRFIKGHLELGSCPTAEAGTKIEP
jgi:hypothetical protein